MMHIIASENREPAGLTAPFWVGLPRRPWSDGQGGVDRDGGPGEVACVTLREYMADSPQLAPKITSARIRRPGSRGEPAVRFRYASALEKVDGHIGGRSQTKHDRGSDVPDRQQGCSGNLFCRRA